LIAGLDFGLLGYVIVGLFLATWASSVAVWKLGGFDAPGSRRILPVDRQTHGDDDGARPRAH
jgi:hypothetical protein